MSIQTTRRGIAYGIIRDGQVTVYVLLPVETTTREAA